MKESFREVKESCRGVQRRECLRMGMFLNSFIPYEAYRDIKAGRFFVDKTRLIGEVLKMVVEDRQKYICITRPRRFGKSVMTHMLGAYLGRYADAGEIFDDLAIAGTDLYREHLNKYNVIYIDLSKIPENCRTYQAYQDRISEGIRKDLLKAYAGAVEDADRSVWDILSDVYRQTGEKFVFIMDEWDAVFHMPFITEEERKAYLLFLKNLLKDQVYTGLAYMTGILPIAKYSDGSELNMFLEYSMTAKVRFGEYFGFSDAEVDALFKKYQEMTPDPRITREDLRIWYDGYYTAAGERMYNPRSIVTALSDNQLANYWTSSGTYDSVFQYVKYNIAAVQDELAILFAGGRITADVQEYAATGMQLETKDEIYSAMVVYGLLTYEHGCVSIPNKEVKDSFASMMKKERSLGYIYELAGVSRKMLAATIAGDTETMADILEYAHNTESPIFAYNSEMELAAVVNLVYLAARDRYRVEREDKAGKGYVDFIFYPECKSEDAIILELKTDHTPEEAIRQIREKAYALQFRGRLGEKTKYTGRVLAVGISYSRKTKQHSCRVEVLAQDETEEKYSVRG